MDEARWGALELRHLLTLRTVAEEGSFSSAADRLGYTQPAVSQQLANLERIVGRRLLERPRGRRPVGLTPAGRVFLRHAETIMASARAAHADLANLGTDGPLRVGSFQSVGTHILPGMLRELRRIEPRVEVRLREAVGDIELLDHVAAGDLDLTFTVLPVPEGPFQVTEILRDPFVLVAPADSPLTKQQPLPIEELARLPLISFQTCDTYKRVQEHLRARGIEPRTVFQSDDNTTIQALVADGVGMALIPRLAADPTNKRTAVVELAAPIPPRMLGLAWHRDRLATPAIRTFVNTAHRVCSAA